MTGLQETDQMPGLSGKGALPAEFEIIRQMPELPTDARSRL